MILATNFLFIKRVNSFSDTIRPVKKLLLIFLLIALPLQYSWAVAATYCEHEKAHTTHFGHHSHHHQAQADEPDNKSKLPQFHSDCGYCHLSCQATILSVATAFRLPEALAPPNALTPSFSSYIPEGPKRPDRQLVA